MQIATTVDWMIMGMPCDDRKAVLKSCTYSKEYRDIRGFVVLHQLSGSLAAHSYRSQQQLFGPLSGRIRSDCAALIAVAATKRMYLLTAHCCVALPL